MATLSVQKKIPSDQIKGDILSRHKFILGNFPERFLILLLFFLFSISLVLFLGCDSNRSPTISTPSSQESLSLNDVQTLITQAVEQAARLNESIVVAVTDREGNVVGVFRMTDTLDFAEDPVLGAIVKARTAAYLSSNQHGFTSLTACFITRKHFPPGIANTAGGPLFGVPFSSLGGGDIQPNGGAVAGQPGLTGVPGGVPVFKNSVLVGGLGISVGPIDDQRINELLDSCTGDFTDETIALGAVIGYSVPDERRGDNIFLDGIRLRYANTETPQSNFTLTFANLSALGTEDTSFPIITSPIPRFPVEGPVLLGGGFDFPVMESPFLDRSDVQQIIDQAVEQANKTRAAIRRPIGSPARVFVSVSDVDGTILGIWRTPDATLFSYDVSAQKARTVVAFSDPTHPLGLNLRSTLGLSADSDLAVTCRAVGFLSQDFYPPGIDRDLLDFDLEEGPLFEGKEFKLQENLSLQPFGNGITIFPGGIPIYKDGKLVGGIGVSGDGVDQDDIIAAAGAIGFEPPPEIRCDQFFYNGVRLPYVKFPRRPEID